MCGIAGVFHFDGNFATLEAVQAMTDVIAHRGPDDQGQFISGPIGLGHRRLSIIDLSSDGKQPMSNEDGTIWVTFNGEIYNHLDIRNILLKRGHTFHSATDTEVIVHAYEEWGVACLERFNGMFAFGVWDSSRKRLWLARDRLGVKPLFYSVSRKGLLFGSEIKAILAHPSHQCSFDYEALSYYLALNYMAAPHTLFKEVRQVMPGHYLMVDASGKMEDVEYWDLRFLEGENKGERAYIEEFGELLEDSIRLRLMSDVPFGAFLSGGIDSSTVAYEMSRIMKEPLNTFSIGFGEPSYDELDYAREVAARIGSKHHETIVQAEAAEILPRLVWHAEEPTADSSMVAFYYLAQATRAHVKMALSGDGADEILAGYETYSAYYLQRLYRLVPCWLRKRLISPLVNCLPVSDAKVSWDFKLRRFVAYADLHPEEAHASWRMIFNAEARRQLLRPVCDRPGSNADVLDLYRQLYRKTNAVHPLNRMLYVDTRFYLPNDMLVKVDRMTMAHGLEAREPFLDYRLVEFAARVPPGLKLKRFTNKKYLLKKFMREKLPDGILSRKKQGFNVPKSRWIKQGLKSFVMDNLSPRVLRDMEILDGRATGRVLSDHFEEKADNSHQIWNLLVLSLWWQQFGRTEMMTMRTGGSCLE